MTEQRAYIPPQLFRVIARVLQAMAEMKEGDILNTLQLARHLLRDEQVPERSAENAANIVVSTVAVMMEHLSEDVEQLEIGERHGLN
jgi:hypothetical protein